MSNETNINFGPELAKALAEFQSECPPITYNKKVDYQTKKGRVKYSYATFDHLLATIRSTLKKNGLAFSQLINEDTSVTTVLIHDSGQYLEGTCKIPSQSDHPQAIGATISYAKRYGLSAILGISAEEDDEEVASSPAGSSRNYRQTQNNAQSKPPVQQKQTTPKAETPDGLDKGLSDQISKARTPGELNNIFKEIKDAGIDSKPYLPLLTNRKKQLTNAS